MKIIKFSVEDFDSSTVEHCGKIYTRNWRIANCKSDQVTWGYIDGPFQCICGLTLKNELEREYNTIIENEKLRLMRQQKLERICTK